MNARADEGNPIKGATQFQVIDESVFAVVPSGSIKAKCAGFTMVTRDPDPLVVPIHPEAMTVLPVDDHARWLGGDYDDVVGF